MVLLLLSVASAAASGLSLSGTYVDSSSWLGASMESQKQDNMTDPVANTITILSSGCHHLTLRRSQSKVDPPKCFTKFQGISKQSVDTALVVLY
jgi:hypothetical protein